MARKPGMFGAAPTQSFEDFMNSHKNMAANWNNMTPGEQDQARQKYQSGGGTALKKYQQLIRNTRTNPPGKGPLIDPSGSLYGMEKVGEAASNMNEDVARYNANMNRTDEETGFGTQSWDWDPATGKYTKSNKMEANLQNRYNEAAGQGALRYGSDAQTPWGKEYNAQFERQYNTNQYDASAERQYDTNQFDTNAQGAPQAPWQENYDTQRGRAEDSVMQKFDRRMEPQFKNEVESFRQRMANEGVDQDSPRYRKLEQELMQRQSDLKLDAQAQALQEGRTEQAQGFGQGIQARGQYAQEDAQRFGQGIQGSQLGMAQQGQRFNQGVQGTQLGMSQQGQRWNQMAQGRQMYTGEQQQQWNSPYQALQGLGQFATGYQGMWDPTSRERMSDVPLVDLGMYGQGVNIQEGRRQGWELDQIDRRGDWNLQSSIAAEAAKHQGDPPP